MDRGRTRGEMASSTALALALALPLPLPLPGAFDDAPVGDFMPLMLSEPRLSCRELGAVGDLALLLPFGAGAAPEEGAEPVLGKLQVELDIVDVSLMMRVRIRLMELSCARPYLALRSSFLFAGCTRRSQDGEKVALFFFREVEAGRC